MLSPPLSESTEMPTTEGPPEPRSKPSSALLVASLALFATVVLLFLLIASFFRSPMSLAHLMLIQGLGILAPSLLFVRFTGRPWRQVLQWRSAGLQPNLGAALMGASLWFVLLSTLVPLQQFFLAVPESFIQERAALFARPETLGGWLLLWGAGALTPAICEELLFRGVLLHGFRSRVGECQAVLAVAVLFAFFHFNPYQLTVTFVQGAVMGWLVVRTASILCGIVFHLLNNSLVLLVSLQPEDDLPLWASVVLVLCLVGGIAIVLRSTSSRVSCGLRAPEA